MKIGLAAVAAFWVGVPAAANEAPSRHALTAEVLARINEVRAHPRDFAEDLREYRRAFDGRVVYSPEAPDGIVTQEGVAAVDEAIDFLERQRPLPPLTRGAVLALAAQDHADEQGDDGSIGHASPDGADPGERVRRRGGDIYVGETISYGYGDADGVVRQLIVDDGVRGRGHRALLFSDGYRFAGVGCGAHRRFGMMCVVDFAATVDGNPQLPRTAAAEAPPRPMVRRR
jgi:uncharacterized protein YkwD